MRDSYDPKAYWEQRLSTSYDLRGVGHAGFGTRYNEWLYRAKQRCLESVLAGLELHGKRVLDVGSGTGFFVDWYLKRGAQVHGLDITEHAVASLSRRFKGEFSVQDISAADYRAGGLFDIVNVWDVTYHIVDEAAFERALINVSASLRIGGLLMVSDRFGASDALRVADHVALRHLDRYRPILTRRGLVLESVNFLYRWLNRQVIAPFIDNRLGAFYYWLDGWCARPAPDNLSLAIWRSRG